MISGFQPPRLYSYLISLGSFILALPQVDTKFNSFGKNILYSLDGRQLNSKIYEFWF